MYRPHEVTEPVTGLRWVARSRGEAMLRWWPTVACLLAFGAGVAFGYSWALS